MRLLVAVTIAAALAAGGCMGGGGGDSDGDATLATFIARADVICGNSQLEISRIPRPTTVIELSTYLERALPIARKQLNQLKDLELPADEGERAQVERLLSLLENELSLNEDVQEAAERRDEGAATAGLNEAAALSAEAGRLSDELGFALCARRA